MSSLPSRRLRQLAGRPDVWLVSLSALVLGRGLRPGIGWFDSGELVSAGFLLGNSHPPGQLPWMLALQPFLTLPFGSVAFRASLLSLVCAVATVYLVYRTVLALTALSRSEPGAWWAALVATPLLVHEGFVLQATRQEVYALAALLAIVAVRLLVAAVDRPAAAVWAALVSAVGFVLNPLIGVIYAPVCVACLWISARRAGWRGAASVVAAFAAPFLILAYPALRSLGGALVDFGEPSTPARWLTYVTAGRLESHSAALSDALALADRVPLNLSAFARASGWLLVPLALVATGALRRGRWAAAAALLGCCLIPASGFLQPIFYPDNPDFKGYLATGVVPLVALGGAGLLALRERAMAVRKERLPTVTSPRLLGAATLAVVAAIASVNLYWPASHADDYRAERMAIELLSPGSARPVAAALWIDNTSFPVMYAQQVGGLRPDSILAITPMFAVPHVRDRLYRDALITPRRADGTVTLGELGAMGYQVILDQFSRLEPGSVPLRIEGTVLAIATSNPGVSDCHLTGLVDFLDPAHGPSRDPIGELAVGFITTRVAILLVEQDQPTCAPAVADLALSWQRGEVGRLSRVSLRAPYAGLYPLAPSDTPTFFRHEPAMLDALAGDLAMAGGDVDAGADLLARGAADGSRRAWWLGMCWLRRFGDEAGAAAWFQRLTDQHPAWFSGASGPEEACRSVH